MKRFLLLLAVTVLPAFVSSCGVFGNSNEQAIVGGGAIAGKDYVLGLQPSDGARDYFNSLSDVTKPIETISRHSEKESKTGVKFVNNGGILIPPGVTISFENKGYCLDPHLPAPHEGDEFQLIHIKYFIPNDLQDTYRNLLARNPRKIMDVKNIHSVDDAEEYINSLRNEYSIQHIVWALRTAGVDAAYADNLTEQQKRILDSCSEYEGLFEVFHSKAKANQKFKRALIDFLDSFGSISIGKVVYKPSDLLDPVAGAQKIGDHLNELIEIGESLPSEHIGFNYGEIEPGIYTDVNGTGSLQYRARIANSTNKPFIFYSSDYVGQVGSPAKKSGLFAAADTTERQHVSGNADKVDVEDQSEPKKECDYCDGFTPFNEMEKIKEQYLRNYIQAERNRRMEKVLYISNSIFFGIPNFFATDQKLSDYASERALEAVLDDTPLGLFKQGVDYYNTMKPFEDAVKFWRKKLDNITWKCPKCKRTHGPLGGFMIPDFN